MPTPERFRPGLNVALLAASLVGSGCVEYARVDPATAQPQEDLRVRVTDDAAVRLARHFGRITDEVTATVQPQGTDSLALTVWLGRDYPGTRFENVRQTVVLDNDEVTAVLRRRLSVWRSVAAAAGVVAVAAVMVDRIFLLENPNGPDGGGPITPPAILLRLMIPSR